MHRIDDEFAVPDLHGEGKPGFTESDPVSGIPATRVSADFVNAVQEEICSVIEGAGLELAKGDNTQLRQAVETFASRDFNDFALANWLKVPEITDEIAGVACAPNGEWLAVGKSGLALKSQDGWEWDALDGGGSENLHAVDCFQEGDGFFVAVGDLGTIRTWTPGQPQFGNSDIGGFSALHGVALARGGTVPFAVAVGENGTVATRSIASTESYSIDAGLWLHDVCHSGQLWCIVGEDALGAAVILTSATAEEGTWTERHRITPGPAFRSVVWHPSLGFIANADSDMQTVVMRSSDGITWTEDTGEVPDGWTIDRISINPDGMLVAQAWHAALSRRGLFTRASGTDNWLRRWGAWSPAGRPAWGNGQWLAPIAGGGLQRSLRVT